MKPWPQFERMGFTPEQIQAARVKAADVHRQILLALEAGEFYCNDPASYAALQRKAVADIEAGNSDHTFCIWQRVNFYLTGDCPALLP